MKKLLFISVLLLAFACSKEDDQKDVDPIVGKWTWTVSDFRTQQGGSYISTETIPYSVFSFAELYIQPLLGV